MTLERLQSWACLILGAAVLVGCSAGANTAQESAALTMGSHGGVLACSLRKSSGSLGEFQSFAYFFNDNDEATISIDRLVIYGSAGASLCIYDNYALVGPHQLNRFSTVPAECLTITGAGNSRLIAYWSYLDERAYGVRNPLSGYSEISLANPATGAVITRFAIECKPIWLKPDPCVGVTCKTVNICGQDAPCETCVDGKCVLNAPNFNEACVPSCGAANSYCGTVGVCGWTQGQCVPSYDCTSCCTQP